MDDQKNLILAVVIATAILLLYYAFVLGPAEERQREALEAQQTEQAATEQVGDDAPPTAASADAAPAGTSTFVSRAEALAQSERIRIETPELAGSIALTGARIDDLSLIQYTREVDPDSGVVTMFSPAGAEGAYYARLGWQTPDGGEAGLPGSNSEWRVLSGDVLTPDTPVTLGYASPDGIEFERTIEIDEHYMFTVTDRVTNRSGADRELTPYGFIWRNGTPESQRSTWLVHEGVIGVLDNRRRARSYKNTQKDGEIEYDNTSGWVGIVDKYWLAALAPAPNAVFNAQFRAIPRGDDSAFQSSWQIPSVQIADGETIQVSSNLFAGAKQAELLREYDETLGITRLDDAIDWGWFWFLTKPFFLLLEFFAGLVGNFGVAILMLTVVVKAATFPLANASYKS
ncbi:MAG: membrane protein insertase YidC, partial [Maricaulaceae bacterium]